MTREEKIICKDFLNDADKTHSCNEYKLLMELLEQEPRWISCSEKLPNLDDFTGSKVWQKNVLITGYLSFDDTKDLFVSEASAKDVIYNRVHNTIVVAWMPLPKAYEPQESEEWVNFADDLIPIIDKAESEDI